MASSSSSSSSSKPRPDEITTEEFFAFHNIDRQLFSRFVFNLRRQPAEAMQAAAFWLWLERLTMAHYVSSILTFPDSVIDAIFEETLLCLRAAETDQFGPPQEHQYGVPMIQSIVGTEWVCLKFFHENRIGVLLAVGNIVQQICLRAFQDLVKVLLMYKDSVPVYDNYEMFPKAPARPPPSGSASVRVGGGGGGGGVVNGGSLRAAPQPSPPIPPPTMPVYNQNLGQEAFFCYPSVMVGDVTVPLRGLVGLNTAGQGASSSGDRSSGASSSGHHSLHLPPLLNLSDYGLGSGQGDLAEFLGQMYLNDQPQGVLEESREAVPASERTIFLTFSKGYPITESQLREFINRSFGDVIDALYMQEVGENEQPLYARLVVRDLSAMRAVLSIQGKAKFSINGKHVWARKYVRKNPNSPPSSPTDH